MQTWYAIFRSWSDRDTDHPAVAGEDLAWTPFGADDPEGHPMQFVGTAADALRQLEDELGLIGRPAVRIERTERRLLIVRDDDGDGGEAGYSEYRLVDTTPGVTRTAQVRMQARRRGARPSPFPAPSTAGPPARFLDEFQEVAGDVAMDFRTTMTDLDEEVGHRVNDFVLELLRLAEDDPGETVRNLMSGMMWMFMVGREHGVRGYSSPVPRGDGESWVPDTVAGIFDGNNLGTDDRDD